MRARVELVDGYSLVKVARDGSEVVAELYDVGADEADADVPILEDTWRVNALDREDLDSLACTLQRRVDGFVGSAHQCAPYMDAIDLVAGHKWGSVKSCSTDDGKAV